MSHTAVLEKNPVWKQTAELAEYAYGLLDQLPEEEAYGISSTLRRVAFAATDDVAEALGSYDPRDKVHHFEHARREIFGLKNALIMSRRLAGVAVDPNAILKIEELLETIDHNFSEAQVEIPKYLLQFDSQQQSEEKP